MRSGDEGVVRLRPQTSGEGCLVADAQLDVHRAQVMADGRRCDAQVFRDFAIGAARGKGGGDCPLLLGQQITCVPPSQGDKNMRGVPLQRGADMPSEEARLPLCNPRPQRLGQQWT